MKKLNEEMKKEIYWWLENFIDRFDEDEITSLTSDYGEGSLYDIMELGRIDCSPMRPNLNEYFTEKYGSEWWDTHEKETDDEKQEFFDMVDEWLTAHGYTVG